MVCYNYFGVGDFLRAMSRMFVGTDILELPGCFICTSFIC